MKVEAQKHYCTRTGRHVFLIGRTEDGKKLYGTIDLNPAVLDVDSWHDDGRSMDDKESDDDLIAEWDTPAAKEIIDRENSRDHMAEYREWKKQWS